MRRSASIGLKYIHIYTNEGCAIECETCGQ